MAKPIITVVGNLGRDPEVIGEGKGTKLNVACGVGKDATDWYNVVIWEKRLREFAEKYLKKGSSIIVSGVQTLQKTENGGYWVNVEAKTIEFAGGQKKKEGQEEKPATEEKQEEVPF